MAVERTYYTIDPEGKLTCMKCKVPLVKGKSKNLCIWRTVFLLRCRSVPNVALSMFRKSWLLERFWQWNVHWRINR